MIKAFKIHASFNHITGEISNSIETLMNQLGTGQWASKFMAGAMLAGKGFVNIKITAMTFGDGQEEPANPPSSPFTKGGARRSRNPLGYRDCHQG